MKSLKLASIDQSIKQSINQSIKANQYPEILKIMEMLDLLDPYYESTENEYEQIKGEE